MGISDLPKNDLNWLSLLADSGTSSLANALGLINQAPPSPSASELAKALAGLAPTNYLGLINSAPPEPVRPVLPGALGLFGSELSTRSDLGAATGNFFGDLSGLGIVSPATSSPLQWQYVTARFTKFLAKLDFTPAQDVQGRTQQAGIIARLNRAYYNHGSQTLNATLIGSWGKGTRTRPPRDADLLYILPDDVYWRYDRRAGNRQSDLLQEVKGVLGDTYSRTDVKGDGQVIVVPFTPSVEVAVGFRCTDGNIIVPNANGGGYYMISTAAAEAADIEHWDKQYNGNVRALARMMKTWQRFCNVDDLKSFWIERLAIEFLHQWESRYRDAFWYDWMVRDFLAYLISRANSWIFVPGTNEAIYLGEGWLSRARTAYSKAVKACDYERDNYQVLAGNEWQDIFGTDIPSWMP